MDQVLAKLQTMNTSMTIMSSKIQTLEENNRQLESANVALPTTGDELESAGTTSFGQARPNPASLKQAIMDLPTVLAAAINSQKSTKRKMVLTKA